MYEVGKIYIWQNQVGEYAYLNETETMVLGGPFNSYSGSTGKPVVEWETDSEIPSRFPNHFAMMAFAGDLRLKEPPPGQAKIVDMFKLPKLEPA